MSSSRIDVPYVAKLARLALSDDEVRTYGEQLGAFLEHVDALREVDTENVPATAQVIRASNVERADIPAQCLARDEVLSMAPRAQGTYFRVPRIIGGDE
jgi:aspartyl-tRNA(Asn)/glutamyl-tRNA(Gln) amidotransferase subunit C